MKFSRIFEESSKIFEDLKEKEFARFPRRSWMILRRFSRNFWKLNWFFSIKNLHNFPFTSPTWIFYIQIIIRNVKQLVLMVKVLQKILRAILREKIVNVFCRCRLLQFFLEYTHATRPSMILRRTCKILHDFRGKY